MTVVRHFAIPVAVLAAFALAGCENEHPNNIPGVAQMNVQGNGVITATAPHDGTVYVYDVGADRVIFSGAVAKGQVITVNTDQNKVLVDNQVRSDRTLNQWNKHRIYFDDTPLTSKHVTVDETVITPSH